MQISKKLKQTTTNLGISYNNASEIYALERLVARLNSDPVLAKALTYKGGFVLFKNSATERYTRDVDATASSIARNVLRDHLEGCWQANLGDGIVFGSPDISDLTIETGDYGGLRLNLKYQLDAEQLDSRKLHKLPKVHLDVGIGEDAQVATTLPLIPLIEGGEELSWAVLPLEYIFAEKLQTLVMRGSQNSRAKDIYDMSILAKELGDLVYLTTAINDTFRNRSTELPGSFNDFLKSLKLDVLRKAWASVRLKTSADFDHTVSDLSTFLGKLDQAFTA